MRVCLQLHFTLFAVKAEIILHIKYPFFSVDFVARIFGEKF